MQFKFFCCRAFDINPMTLKLEGNLDILIMYLHTENEEARLSNAFKTSKAGRDMYGYYR